MKTDQVSTTLPLYPPNTADNAGGAEQLVLLAGWQLALLVFVGYLICAEMGAALLSKPYGFTVLWLPSGFYLGCLLLSTRWPLIVLAACCANFVFDEQFLHGTQDAKPVLVSLGFCLANTLEALTGASLMRRFVSPSPSLRTTREVLGLAGFCAILSPALGAFIGGTIAFHAFGGDYWQVLGMWWSGDMVSVFAITPLILTVRARFSKSKCPWNKFQVIEFLAITTITLFLTALVFSEKGAGLPHKYMTIPFLLVAALRFGPLGTAVTCALMAITAGWSTQHLSGQFTALSVGALCSLIIEVQSFLGIMALTALVVSAVLEERKDAEEKIKSWNTALEERVKERTIQLEDTNRELETFSYSVSHDLRTPLRSINGFSQALREDAAKDLGDQSLHYLDEVQGAAQRMGQLIDDLLKLSRIQRNEIKRSWVDLSAIVGRFRDNLQAQHPTEWIIAPHVLANADKYLLEDVLENLLNNAVKFTAKKTQARIEFGITQNAGPTAYYVRDNGAGFDMKYVGKLFTPFQRLHRMTEFEGHGVGLATVQRIIQRHGGKIWAEGIVDQGATFFFTLEGGM